MTEHSLRDVLSRAVERYGEVVDGRLISCLCLHGLRVDKLPCGVRIVLQCEFLRLSVLLHDEGGDKLRLFCSLRYLHTFLYVRAHTIGTEVECGEGIEAIEACEHDVDDRIVQHYPLVALRYEPLHVLAPPCHNYGTDEQHDVLRQCLAIGKLYGIAEASAVFHRVGGVNPYRQRCHKHHHR